MNSPGSRPPRPALPPEDLDDIDYKWGEEPPTVVYPTSTHVIVRSSQPAGGEDTADRVTAIPEVPGDEFARRLMAAAIDLGDGFGGESAGLEGIPPAILDREAEALAPAPPRAPDPDFERDLQRELSQGPGSDFTLLHPSAMPTAPPSMPKDPASSGPVVRDRPASFPPPSSPAAWNGPALDATLRPPRSITPRSHAAVSYEFPSYASAPPEDGEALLEMRDRFAMGDFSGAMAIAEEILSKSPDQKEAASLAEKCRDVLFDMYGSRLSNLDEPPRIIMSPEQLRWLSLDHRAGFLLSMVDGLSTLEEILDVSGMSRLDSMRILCELLDRKVITIG